MWEAGLFYNNKLKAIFDGKEARRNRGKKITISMFLLKAVMQTQ